MQSEPVTSQRDIENYPAEDLRLDFSTAAILKNARIKTVGEIIRLAQECRLMRVRNLGKKHYCAIETQCRNWALQ